MPVQELSLCDDRVSLSGHGPAKASGVFVCALVDSFMKHHP